MEGLPANMILPISMLKYAIVDYENCPAFELGPLEGQIAELIIVSSTYQGLRNLELAGEFVNFNCPVRLIEVAKRAPNAADFIICFEVGKILAKNPAASIHIISRDRGFDPLIANLTSEGFVAARHRDLAHRYDDIDPPNVERRKSYFRHCATTALQLTSPAELPKNKEDLRKFLIIHVSRNKLTRREALEIISDWVKAKLIIIDQSGKVDFSPLIQLAKRESGMILDFRGFRRKKIESQISLIHDSVMENLSRINHLQWVMAGESMEHQWKLRFADAVFNYIRANPCPYDPVTLAQQLCDQGFKGVRATDVSLVLDELARVNILFYDKENNWFQQHETLR